MSSKEVKQLTIDTLVQVDVDYDQPDLKSPARVVLIDSRRKRIGVVSVKGIYYAFPYRKVKRVKP